jgi:hypothetical protein
MMLRTHKAAVCTQGTSLLDEQKKVLAELLLARNELKPLEVNVPKEDAP